MMNVHTCQRSAKKWNVVKKYIEAVVLFWQRRKVIMAVVRKTGWMKRRLDYGVNLFLVCAKPVIYSVQTFVQSSSFLVTL